MLSVVIPLYNKEDSIEQTLKSVISQSVTQFEIIVVDDGSTDRSLEIVRSFSDERIKIISKENGGVSSARNIGIQEAQFTYIAFLDADDFWESNYLEEQSKLINTYPEAAMWGVGWGYLESDKKKEIDHLTNEGFCGIIENYWTLKKNSNLFWTSAVVLNKKVCDKVGYFDERIRYGEDLDMWYRIMLNYPVVFCNKTLAYYRIDAENRAMTKKIPLSSLLPFYLGKYEVYKKRNADFKRYFDRFCLAVLFPYYLENKHDPEVQRILKSIDLSDQPLTQQLRFRFPRTFQFLKELKRS